MEPRITIQTSLEGYFDGLLRDALRAEKLTLSDPASAYLVQLVTEYSGRDVLYGGGEPDERGTPALASLYQRAIEAAPRERFAAYRQLGDVALVVAGLFGPHVARKKAVDLRYYADMGAAAYHHAALLATAGFEEILGELSASFGRVLEVFTRIAERTTLPVKKDVGTLFERWSMNPDSAELMRRLIGAGLVPVIGGVKAA